MIDFVFFNKINNDTAIEKSITSIYPDKVTVYSSKGEWGGVICSYRESIKYGYGIYETQDSLFCLIGSPLYKNNSSFRNEENKGIAEIYNDYKETGVKIVDYLNGPFAILHVNKKDKSVEVVTDLLSLIPIYTVLKGDKIVIGSHVDVVAGIYDMRSDYDHASLAEFSINGRITYPYTAYKTVRQMAPSSVLSIDCVTHDCRILQYWSPSELNAKQNINDAAEEISSALHSYCKVVSSDVDRVAMMMSGGEDSRLILSILSEYTEVDSCIFLDEKNREGMLAKKACDAYDSNLDFLLRDRDYYLNIHQGASRLVGLGHQYMHVHAFLFINDISKNIYKPVFGGYLSDALLKGSRAEKYNLDRFGLYYDLPKKTTVPLINKKKFGIFIPRIIDEINERRVAFENLDFINSLGESNDWKGFYPSSTYKSSSHFFGHRRFFPIFEPYTSTTVIKSSAGIPLVWKTNRILFQKIAKINLKKTKFLSHTDGHFPYYPWYWNMAFVPVVRTNRKLGSMFRGAENDGPWTDFGTLVGGDKYNSVERGYNKDVFENIFSVPFDKAVSSKHFSKSNRLSVLQVLNHASSQ